jgi:hypothetical protein
VSEVWGPPLAGGGIARSHRWLRRVLPLATAVGVALTLAACSSSPTASKATTTTTGRSTSTTATTTAPTSTSSPSSTTSTTAAGVTTCLASQLSIGSHAQGAAAGTIYLTVTLTNISSSTCTLSGYPGMQLLGAQGTAIPTNVVRGGLGAGAPAAAQKPPSLVTLLPQQVATFSLMYEDVPEGNETTCPTSSRAEITPPNDVTPGVVTLRITPCGGGTVHVSPVFVAS